MTLAALAYERYIRVVHAQVVDFPWAWRAIGHIWMYSLAWTGAPLLGWNRYTLEIHQLGCSLDWASKDPNDASFILFFLLACFFVPVGIMIYCYSNILYTVQMVRPMKLLMFAYLYFNYAHFLQCIYIASHKCNNLVEFASRIVAKFQLQMHHMLSFSILQVNATAFTFQSSLSLFLSFSLYSQSGTDLFLALHFN